MNRTRPFLLLLAIVVFYLAEPAFGTSGKLPVILHRNEGLSVEAMSRFVTKGITGSLTRKSKTDPDKQELRYKFSIDMPTKSKWRINTEYPDGYSGVFVRNRSLYFSANKEPKSKSFEYVAVGYDTLVKREVSDSAMARTTIVQAAFQFLSMTPREFIESDPSLVLSESEKQDDSGRVLRYVNWQTPDQAQQGYFAFLGTGELAEANHITSKVKMRVDYENGIPIEIVMDQGVDNIDVYTVTATGSANEDAKYYTPESLGLTSPPLPWSSYYPYALSIVAITGCLLWYLSRNKKQQSKV
jgi:hypothetical protein